MCLQRCRLIMEEWRSMQRQNLQNGVLFHRQGGDLRRHEIGRTGHETMGEISEPQMGTEFARKFHQQLSAAMLLAGDVGQSIGFEQTAKLGGEDGGFGGKIGSEKIRLGSMEENGSSDALVGRS